MKSRSSLAFLLAIVCAGCVAATNLTTGNLVTSPYYKPASEPGVFYHYGNFCGAQFPKHAPGASREERIKLITSTTAVDTIDQACKQHDLCYEVEFHDSFECDQVLWELIGPPAGSNWGGEFRLAHSCDDLANEIVAGVNLLKPNVKAPGVNMVGGIHATVGAASAATGTSVVYALGQHNFPSEPGHCFLLTQRTAHVNNVTYPGMYAVAR